MLLGGLGLLLGELLGLGFGADAAAGGVVGTGTAVGVGAAGTGTSAAGVPIYLPKFSIHAAKARLSKPTAFGTGFDPDFSKAPLLTYNTVHTPLLQPSQADKSLVWTVTYNKAVAVNSKEIILKRKIKTTFSRISLPA